MHDNIYFEKFSESNLNKIEFFIFIFEAIQLSSHFNIFA